ncbi:MAG: UvrD-helicase domain-containing protein [Desulfobacterales bacterium]
MTSPIYSREILADLHLHSRFSRATARGLSLGALHTAAQLKGLHLVATGDATHPAWFAEIEAELRPAEAGLWRLDPGLAKPREEEIPPSCRQEVRFILSSEISLIYKKDGRTRKNHNLVYFPDMESLRLFNRRLEKIGNTHSDGRPILGMDARDLLALLLDTCPEAFLVPAHIWTPWFSVLGSQSGFDSLEECFGDLTGEIFAVETGLSSDPPMNRRVSFLDGVRLISNSDAHSAENLAREANRLCFAGEPSFFSLRDALKGKGEGEFLGTIEFYPEEGKYHYDGHRQCGMRFSPQETRRHGGICPRCAKPLTVGVLHRVESLADRDVPTNSSPKEAPFESLIPLADILAEIFQAPKTSRKVAEARRRVLSALGPELAVLRKRSTEEIRACGVPLLDEAIARMRRGEIEILPGCDGEYGKIRIFREQEREVLCGQKSLFAKAAVHEPLRRLFRGSSAKISDRRRPGDAQPMGERIPELTEEQRRIVESPARRLLVTAGPGTGKTHVLTLRIARRIEEGIPPSRILAVTFTRKAAEEMSSRLTARLKTKQDLPWVTTFHGLCLRLLREEGGSAAECQLLHEIEQEALVARAIRLVHPSGEKEGLRARDLRARIIAAKQALLAPEEIAASGQAPGDDVIRFRDVYARYQMLLTSQGLLDLEDPLFRVARRLETDAAWRESCRSRFSEIFVDEYQDLNFAQYRILRHLAPSGCGDPALTAIGDPDQAIYGFRGSDPSFFRRFHDDYPDAVALPLAQNFRSHPAIVRVSRHLIAAQDDRRKDPPPDAEVDPGAVRMRECADEDDEARFIAREIRRAVGATGFHEKADPLFRATAAVAGGSYRDFAILTRTTAIWESIARELARNGIPYQRVSRRESLLEPETLRLVSFLRLGLGRANLEDLAAAAGFLDPPLPPACVAAFVAWAYERNLRLEKACEAAERFPIAGLKPREQRRLLAALANLRRLQCEVAQKKEKEAISQLLGRGRPPGEKPDPELASARGALEAMLLSRPDEADGEILDRLLTASTDGDFYEAAAQRVALMTLHGAKGLEFPVVFIAGCEEGFLPWEDGEAEENRLEEELRLLYVGLTRAKQSVILSWARRRLIRGKRRERSPSPFLSRLPAVAEAATERPVKREPRQMDLFS